jgi:hypothetical protein
MDTVEGNTGKRAHAEAEFSGRPPEIALACAQDAALRIPRAHLRSSEAEAVEVAVGMNLRSWGEVVRISAQARGERERTLLHIESRSKLAITLADWGKNRRNVDMVLEGLRGMPDTIAT